MLLHDVIIIIPGFLIFHNVDSRKDVVKRDLIVLARSKNVCGQWNVSNSIATSDERSSYERAQSRCQICALNRDYQIGAIFETYRIRSSREIMRKAHTDYMTYVSCMTFTVYLKQKNIETAV